jgi:hypothetical protein
MRLHGYPAVIHAAYTSWGENAVQNETVSWPRIVFLTTLAGPAVNFGLAITGLIFLRRYTEPPVPNAGLQLGYWTVTLASLAGLRWLISLIKYPQDELQLSQQLGLDPYVVPVMMLPVSILVLILIFRCHLRAKTMKPLLLAIPFGFAGALLWLFFIGPLILGG